MGFFLQTTFDFLTSHFWQYLFISFESYCCPKLKFEKNFTHHDFLYSYGGLKIAILVSLANLGQLTRDIIYAINP